MFVALVHTVTLGLLFCQPQPVYIWVLVIPFFCLITLNKRDWFAGLFPRLRVARWYFRMASRWLSTTVRSGTLTGSYALYPSLLIFGVVVFVTGIFWSFHRRLARAEGKRGNPLNAPNHCLNILPITIADRLKNREGFIADDIDEASVLFATWLGSDLASIRVCSSVEALNEIFWAF